MSIKLDQDSETASEEEEIEETKSRGGKDDGSGFIDGTVKSDKDTSPTERYRLVRLLGTKPRNHANQI